MLTFNIRKITLNRNKLTLDGNNITFHYRHDAIGYI
jgi:hypothetical protein